jgi:hypothetical protein
MELAALIVAFGVLVVSGVAAAAAVVQARAASTARNEADKAVGEARSARDESARLAALATAAFVRQAEAQERANQLKEQEMAPAPWTTRFVSGALYQAVNTSGRAIHVDRFEIEPDGTERRVRLGGHEDGLYQFGDAVDYMVSRVMGANARKLTIFWRFADEPDSELSEFIITL